MTTPAVDVIHLGCYGHFVGVASCRWHRHTQVGDQYRISTVGNYFPLRDTQRQPLGNAKSFFETMVFTTLATQAPENEGCGCHAVIDWIEVDRAHYATAAAAQAGHETFVEKYRRRLVAEWGTQV